VTPSVAAPGDTNLTDTTEQDNFISYYTLLGTKKYYARRSLNQTVL